MKIINLVLAISFFLFICSCGKVKKNNDTNNNSNKDTTNIVVADNLSSANDSTELSNKSDLREVDDESLIAGKFYLIVGSFENKNNADILKTKLVKKGINAEVLEPFHGFNRVSMKQFDNKVEAINALTKIRKKNKNKDAWVLTKK